MTVLGVFFTRGVSLQQWVETGLFDREVLIYRHHLDNGVFDEIVWFTYGARDEAAARRLYEQGRLPLQIRVVPMPEWVASLGRVASLVYAFIMPFVIFRELARCTVFKTNQMDGATAAVMAAWRLKRPLYVRTGYTLSLFVERIHPRNPLRRGLAWLTEWIAFRRCTAAAVSSRHDRDYVVRRYRLSATPPAVVGNYIDIEHFSPRPGIEARERMVYIGRLSAQKNLEAALRASVSAGIGLDIVGDGPERDTLQKLGRDLGADVGWLGTLPNACLPEVLASYRYFFLPSLWEGMPKALLEAMAAGLVCIGNDALGINEVIADGVTGYLSTGPEAANLAEAVARARTADRGPVAAAARNFVRQNFSLDAVAAAERAIFSKILSTAR